MEPKNKRLEKSNVIQMPGVDQVPVDYAISMVMQNMFATYGEAKVRASMKQLFGMNSKKKKAA